MRTRPTRLARLLPLPALVACARPPDPSQVLLPTQLSILAEQDGAAGPEPVSLVLDLRRNSRDQLDVRVAPGLRLWDGKHLWEVTATDDARGHGLHVGDLKAGLGGDVPLFGATPLTVLAMTRRDLWVRLPNQAVFDCELARATCTQAPDLPAGKPEPLPMSHPGPGSGFELSLTDGSLELRLPFGNSGVALLDHVHRLIGVHWVHEAWLDHDPLLDRTYRGRASLTAAPRTVTRDGDLHDWTDAEPLVVDSPWQVEAGGEYWSGARDASFSITVARTPDGLCFAGRVRDDDWTPADELVLHVDGAEPVHVPLGAPDGTAGQSVAVGWFSRAFEVCPPGLAGEPGEVPFAAAFEDHDRAGMSVVSTAPTVGGVGGGALRLGS